MTRQPSNSQKAAFIHRGFPLSVWLHSVARRNVQITQAEQLQPSEAARIFEGQLASALVAEDGQLALSNLAVSAAHGFMPKIQTQGQLGQARWRLVSAPSIPGIFAS